MSGNGLAYPIFNRIPILYNWEISMLHHMFKTSGPAKSKNITHEQRCTNNAISNFEQDFYKTSAK